MSSSSFFFIGCDFLASCATSSHGTPPMRRVSWSVVHGSSDVPTTVGVLFIVVALLLEVLLWLRDCLFRGGEMALLKE